MKREIEESEKITRKGRIVLPAGRQGSSVYMYYVYILKSLKDGNLYIGRTNDVPRRLFEHNRGRVLSIRSRVPFVLLKTIATQSEIDSVLIEKEYKKGYKREELKKEFGRVA